MTVLVTGARGFVGVAVCLRLTQMGTVVRPVVRTLRHDNPFPNLGLPNVIDLGREFDCSSTLIGVDEVIHLAARVHLMDDPSADPLHTYRQVNVAGTLKLAQQASVAGVRRFVFVSSIKVLGEASQPGKPFTADELPAPLDFYSVSKLEAEQGLREIERKTGMEVVIVRPPLVYGPGVKGNFAWMIRLVSLGVPLPLGSIHNVRSLVALDNLVDLLITCLKHPAAAGQTFLVSDGEDVSTSELLRRIARAMDKRSVLIPVPSFMLEGAAALLGKHAVVRRLCGSLQVDIEKTRCMLGWNPLLTLDEGLMRAVR